MVDAGLLGRLEKIVGEGHVMTGYNDRAGHAVDQWARLRIAQNLSSAPEAIPDVVVRPKDVNAVTKLLSLANESFIPVVPFGMGTGVCGGVMAAEGGLSLDLSRLDKIVKIDELSMVVTVEAGVKGSVLESALAARGYTLGHCPMWIGDGTVGGWASSRVSGWFSSAYGAFEDMVVGMDIALPDGGVISTENIPREFGYPDFRQFFLGAEGMLGVIVRLRLKISRIPKVRRFRTYRFMDLDMGLEAMRRIMQQGMNPFVMRLMDPFETLVSYFGSGGVAPFLEQVKFFETVRRLLKLDLEGVSDSLLWPTLKRLLEHPFLVRHLLDHAPMASMLFVGFEGDEQATKDDLDESKDLITRATGVPLGPEPAEHWFKRRNQPLSYDKPIFDSGGFVETLAVAGLWRDLSSIYHKARALGGVRILIPAFFSNASQEGAVCHFRLLGMAKSAQSALDLYDWAVPRVIKQAMAEGSTVSYGSGIGLAKRDFIEDDYRGGGRLFWALRQAFDPQLLMNPQKLYPTTVPVAASKQDEIVGGGNISPVLTMTWDHRLLEQSVVTPEVPEEIVELLQIARRSDLKVVCQTGERVSKPKNSDVKTLTIRLDQMDRVIHMDPVSCTVTVQSGMSMIYLENFLREKGFTLGYAPRARLSLSVGEYLASVAPHEGSPRYGTVRDNCIGLSAFLADGHQFSVRPAPGRSAGPNLMHAFIGTRGRLGIITAACFRVFPWPAVSDAVAFGCSEPKLAVAAIREILLQGIKPAWVLVVLRAPGGSRSRSRVVIQMEGSRRYVSHGMSVIREKIEPLGMTPENIRAEERLVPPPKLYPSVERFLPMDQVMSLVQRFSQDESPQCPEVHVTHFSSQGATVRLLLRDRAHQVPEDLASVFEADGTDEPLAKAFSVIKAGMDPEDLLLEF
ncbi:MAG TPA: FAD-binding oxidoreductase [Myxococcota bacterium]|jgi:alkyldihydroxyacetonephosphate synthase|nr:FAD-binding oxidoreductase [Myxococcota bacterium]MBP8971443.1 FAD-binding oxidoreductase [Myxococcota bacterium]OQC43056.1 MAG: putative FAD-linked oxidoreductase [Deltaproteobacteria bacterium ADurb.Bin058]HQC45638.1 FAD-binding oxidoreductase [Myxococcota bacterium]HQL56849.1 FAD-binding oxidoreductase [Myxococcota bacterium]